MATSAPSLRPHPLDRAGVTKRKAAALALACFGAFGLVSLAGCEDDEAGSLTLNGPPGSEAPAEPAKPAEPAPAGPLPAGAFAYGREIVLLPFDVRLAKIARVVGIPPEDALLKPLRDRRLDLGGYDFAQNVKPDTSWTSARLTMWIKNLKPVCGSPAMRSRYAALPEKLPDLVLSAYGRRATDDDRRIVEEAIAGAPLDEAGKYTAICLTVLSSLEFVAR